MSKHSIIVMISLVACCFIGYALHQHSIDSNVNNTLVLQNVEALSDNETPEDCYELCTRAIKTANCYKNGKWVATRVVEIEEYERTTCAHRCYHDHVTNCPIGSTEGL